MPMTPKVAAEKIREAAKAWEHPDYKLDAEMTALHKSDAADLELIAALIEKEDLRRARIRADSLDTIIREEIPNDVWKWLHE